MNCSDAPLDNITTQEKDGLDRKRAVLGLQELLCAKDVKTPLSLGVFGGWGMGKTSVMRSLRRTLESRETNRLVVWFDAWVYARQEEALWRALLLQVIAALRAEAEPPDGTKLQGEDYDLALRKHNSLWTEVDAQKALNQLDDARASLYRSLVHKETNGVRVNWWGALPLAADAMLTAVTAGLNHQVAEAIGGKGTNDGLTAALTKWFKGKDTQDAVKLIERQYTEHYVEQVASLEQFQKTFHDVLKLFNIGGGEKQRRLYIFIDDLDRCLPEDALGALEAIKLFLDLEGCIFVLGMDRQVVEQGIAIRYASFKDVGFDPRAYLDKIIQIPFTLPPLSRAQIKTYIDTLISGNTMLQDCRDVIAATVPPNPRTIKRVLNALLLIFYMDSADAPTKQIMSNQDRTQLLAKLALLQTCYEDVWKDIISDISLLSKLEKAADGAAVPDLKIDLAKHPRLDSMLKSGPQFIGLPQTTLTALLTMTRITR